MKYIPIKKLALAFLSFTVLHLSAIAQEPESILSAPDNWKGEILTFPLSFAPTIPFTGFEDLRFAPGWSDSTSNEFWSYMFVWYIDEDLKMTESRLSTEIEKYYDGLMGVTAPKPKNHSQPKETLSIFIKTEEGFKGKMHVYDAFFTKKEIVLYLKVREMLCSGTNKQIIWFEVSPNEFDSIHWDIFKNVQPKNPCK